MGFCDKAGNFSSAPGRDAQVVPLGVRAANYVRPLEPALCNVCGAGELFAAAVVLRRVL